MSERRTPLEQFLARLRDLGATPDEMARVAEHWDDLDPDDCEGEDCFTRADRDTLAASSDAQLRALILDGRAEYEHGTTTQDEADAADRRGKYEAALADAMGRIGGNVTSLLEWVGDDSARALAVLTLEGAPEGAGRKTLIDPLQALSVR